MLTALAAWLEIFDAAPPKRLRAETLQRHLAQEVKCRVLGGLTARDKRSLRSIASGRSPGGVASRTGGPGAHLIREWNGRTYRVEVTKDGYDSEHRGHPSVYLGRRSQRRMAICRRRPAQKTVSRMKVPR
ncbi:DUF2924 domain-containing protein [Silicimonas algicola]|uniref:DUF2924 domain-containing protein n=1 Tax=Silicimonas algicola TaxID=1826607 RepID=UPI000D6D2377|nr:DUF2924 domain-containing protein [Silicimonas algicola]